MRAIGISAQVVAVAIALGVLAGVLSDGQWPWVFATYVRWPQTLLATIAAGTLLRLAWWRSGIPAALLAVGLVVSIAAPLQALDTTAADGRPTLRIGVHNTGFQRGDVAEVAAQIAEADLDIVVLLESEDIADDLDRRLDDLTRMPTPGPRGRDSAPPAVLAREPWPTTVVPLGDERPATVVTADLGGSALDIVGFHPLPPALQQWAVRHDAAVDALVADALPRDGARVLACDCNSTPWSPSMRRLLGSGLRGPTVTPTFGAPLIGIPIDHVLLSDQVEATSREHWSFAGSDHQLIVTEVVLRDAAPAP